MEGKVVSEQQLKAASVAAIGSVWTREGQEAISKVQGGPVAGEARVESDQDNVSEASAEPALPQSTRHIVLNFAVGLSPSEQQQQQQQKKVDPAGGIDAPELQRSSHHTLSVGVPGAFRVEGVSPPEREGSEISMQDATVNDEEENLEDFHVSHALVVDEEQQQQGICDATADPPSSGELHSTEVIDGKIETNRTSNQQRNQLKYFFGLILLVIVSVAVGTTLALTVGSRSAEEGPVAVSRDITNITNDVLIYPPFQANLSVAIQTAIEQDLDSPFYKANVWMWNDPNMASYTQERQRQRFYLVMFYFATNGDHWLHNDHWLSYNTSECNWFTSSSFPSDSPYFPTQVCTEDDTLVSLSLAFNNLTGVWALNYAPYLPYLKVFDIGHNQVGGHLPTITTTFYIEVIVLSQNLLVGTPVLEAGGHFDNLKVMKVDGLQIRGNNGGSLYYITPKLEVINSTGEFFDGPIWTTHGLLTNLKYLGMGHTEAVGTVPTELGLMTNLMELDMSSLPYISGTLPPEIGHMTKLTHLDLSDTPLWGSIPAGLCSLVADGVLDISANCSSLECC